MIDAYPLQWPPMWPRTDRPQRSRFDTTLGEARSGVLRELGLLGARDVVISSNVPTRRDGLRYKMCGIFRGNRDILDGTAGVLETPSPPLTTRSGISRGGLMPTVQIPLTQGKFAIVDAEDAHRVRTLSWCAIERERTWYAQAYVRGTSGTGRRLVYLHRFILNAPDGVLVDHENGDGLDCRRSNLRRADHAENAFNARLRSDNHSGYRGVSWSNTDQCWKAFISARGVRKALGRFADPVAAALAYDDAARELHGEFARLNFPERIAS